MRRAVALGSIVVAALVTGATPAFAAPAPPCPAPPALGASVAGLVRIAVPVPLLPCPPVAGGPTGEDTSAAALQGWREPVRTDEFDGPLGDAWEVYDGPGHAGNGRRTPEAVSVRDGLLTITGD